MPIVPRVLLLADHFGYSDGVVHGLTTYYQSVLPRVLRQGVDLRCCFLRDEHPLADQLRKAGVPVEFLGLGKWNPFVLRQVEAIARAMQANVIHAMGMKAVVVARRVARRTGASPIIHSHDMNLPSSPVRLMYRILKVEGERGLAVSAAAANQMASAYCVDRQDVVVLPNGVDVSGIRLMPSFERPAGLPDARRLIGWIGRFHEVKGPQRMIRMMAAFSERVPDVGLVMVGDGPEMSSCVQLIEELGLQKRVTLLGQRADVSRLLKQMQVLCISSHKEGFSLVAAEAAAAGVPVVAFDVGGVGEVVADGQTGYLVPDGDTARFVEVLQQLVDDEGLRAKLARQAASHADGFSIDHHVTLLIAEYRRAAERSKTGNPA